MNGDFLFWASSVVACMSLTGAFLNANKKWYSFVVWAIANLFWVVYDFTVGAYFQSALFLAYLSMNAYGLYQWKYKKQDSADQAFFSEELFCDKVITAKKLQDEGVSAEIINKVLNLPADVKKTA